MKKKAHYDIRTKEKVRDFVYKNEPSSISRSTLLIFYWGCFVIPWFMFSVGAAFINMMGVNWMTLFPFISFGIWSLFYWVFVITVLCKKKTYELRFLVNGVFEVLISSLFWIFASTVCLLADKPFFFDFSFMLWVLVFYLLFSAIYIRMLARSVHKGTYKKWERTYKSSILPTLVFPSMGAIGIWISRAARHYLNVSVQGILITLVIILIIYLPAFGHINFLNYYYCKKYKIDCDARGKRNSPMLERPVKDKKQK